MYMPNLMPRDVHHLWLSTDQPPHSAPQQRGTDTATSNFSAPPLSSYSSERPGPTAGNVDEKLRQLKAIRTLGYTYLAPLGLGKTMQMLVEESEIRRQMEEQFQSETATAENLMGEADLLQQQNSANSDNQQQDAPQPVRQGTPVQQQQQPATPQQQELPQRDLDDDIPDADDAEYEYDDEVDDVDNDAMNSLERQYDRGFMITEQYESDEESHQQPQLHQSPVQFTTPQRDFNTSRHQHHLAHSGSMGSIATAGGTTFESSFEANVSMNASDLDMTIDD